MENGVKKYDIKQFWRKLIWGILMFVACIFLVISGIVTDNFGASCALLIFGQVIFLAGGVVWYLVFKINYTTTTKLPVALLIIFGALFYGVGGLLVGVGEIWGWLFLELGICLLPIGVIKLMDPRKYAEQTIWGFHHFLLFALSLVICLILGFTGTGATGYNISGIVIFSLTGAASLATIPWVLFTKGDDFDYLYQAEE